MLRQTRSSGFTLNPTEKCAKSSSVPRHEAYASDHQPASEDPPQPHRMFLETDQTEMIKGNGGDEGGRDRQTHEGPSPDAVREQKHRHQEGRPQQPSDPPPPWNPVETRHLRHAKLPGDDPYCENTGEGDRKDHQSRGDRLLDNFVE